MLFKIITEMVAPNTIEINLYVSLEEDKWKHIPVQFRSVDQAWKYAVEYKKNYTVTELEL